MSAWGTLLWICSVAEFILGIVLMVRARQRGWGWWPGGLWLMLMTLDAVAHVVFDNRPGSLRPQAVVQVGSVVWLLALVYLNIRQPPQPRPN